MTRGARSILIIEDDVDVREAVAQTLQDAGYLVQMAGNGQEALDQLRAATTLPRLIILDLMMPWVDGWRFREEQSREPSLRRIPVVVLTAHGPLTRPIDAVAILQKPIPPEQLLDVVARVCGLPARPRN